MIQLNLPLVRANCRFYGICAAPLCPMDLNLGICTWFPNEPICRLRRGPGWVRKQRNIAKLPGIERDRYFTLRMLNSIKQIRKGLRGAEADLPGAEKSWLCQRQQVRPVSRAKQLHHAQLKLEI